jgi:hypothetical protein
MTKKLLSDNSTQAIAAINILIIPNAIKFKLKTIAEKILQSLPLSQSKNIFWNSFSNSGKSWISTGDSQCLLEFTLYQESNYQFESEFDIKEILPPQVVAQVNLYFDPPTSPKDSDDIDNPD